MTRTVSIGGATYDVFIQLPQDTIRSCCGDEAFTLLIGEKIRTQKVLEYCGGGASNTAVALARLGCDAAFCGIVGDDQWGQKLIMNLQTEGVDTRCATIVEGEVSSFSIVLSAGQGDRSILYDPGTNAHLHDVTFDKEAVANADWVYLNHIHEDSCVIQNDLVEIFVDSNPPGLTWNPGGCQLDVGLEAPTNKDLLSHTNLLLLNKEEALKFFKCSTIDEAITLANQGGAQAICITDGKNGTIASDGTTRYHCPIIEATNVADTTGAGDAFGAGATWALANGESLPQALQAGSMNASSVVSAFGAQAGLLTNIEMHTRTTESPATLDARPLL